MHKDRSLEIPLGTFEEYVKYAEIVVDMFVIF